MSPLQRMVVEIAGVGALGWFFARGWRAPRTRATSIALAIIGALVLLVVLQSIPLPPNLWRALPGREVAANVLDVIGARESWLPLSLDPASTRDAGYFLIPPIAMFIATLHLDRDAQVKLIAIVLVAALLSALLVMVQAQGAMGLSWYDAPHATKGKGIFANKNHNAVFIVLSIPLAAMLARSRLRFRRASTQHAVTAILVAVLALAVLGCLSRAGFALLPIALLACIPLLGMWATVRRYPLLAVGAVVLLLGAAVLVSQSSIVQEGLDRFGASQEGRYVFWPDVVAAIRQFMPWGSGLGTFVPVFRMNETLNAVHQTYTNHAHSDFMEIALEAGIPGLLLVLAFLGWLATTAWSQLRTHAGRAGFGLLFASAVGIVLLLAASVVDYPLRTLLLACVFAVFAAILCSPATFEGGRSEAADPGLR
jgi:O-antigen ligase